MNKQFEDMFGSNNEIGFVSTMAIGVVIIFLVILVIGGAILLS